MPVMKNDIQNLNGAEFCDPHNLPDIANLKSINSYLQDYDHLLDDEYYNYGAIRQYPKLLVFDKIMKESNTGPEMYKMEKLHNIKNYIFEPIDRFKPTIDPSSPVNLSRGQRAPKM